MIKYGQIITRDDMKGTVTVKFERPAACGSCNACGYGAKKSEVTLPSDRSVGEWVRVELPENRFIMATALVYIVPLAGLILGLFLGWLLGSGSDLWTVSGAFFGLVLSLGVLFTIDRKVSQRAEWTPKITDVYPQQPEPDGEVCDRT